MTRRIKLISTLFIVANLLFACHKTFGQSNLEQANAKLEKLRSQLSSIQKTEFETTTQFNERKVSTEQTLHKQIDDLLARLYSASLAFRMGKYNADDQLLDLEVISKVSIATRFRLIMPIDEAKKIKDALSKQKLQGTFWLEEEGSFYQFGKAFVNLGGKTYYTLPASNVIRLGRSRTVTLERDPYSVDYLRFSSDATSIAVMLQGLYFYVYSISDMKKIGKYTSQELPREYETEASLWHAKTHKPQQPLGDELQSYLVIAERSTGIILRNSRDSDFRRIYPTLSRDLRFLASLYGQVLHVQEIEDMRLRSE